MESQMPSTSMNTTPAQVTVPGQRRLGARSWIMALRPKTLTAALVPILVASALVVAEDRVLLEWISIFALLSAIFIQIGTNLVNDAIDFAKGADTEKRVGPQRVTQSGLLTSRQVMAGGIACFAIALGLGIPLVVYGGWPIVVIGLVSLFLGYAYTGGPYPLAYKGLGDLFVILFFGIIAVGGVYYLQTGAYSTPALVAGLQIGFLATVLIAINNLRDAPLDALCGKRTLAVRFGVRFARMEIAFFSIAPFVLGVYWILENQWMAGILPLMSLPLARRLVHGVFASEPGPVYNKYLAMSAGLHMLFGVLLTLALWMG